MEFEMPRGVPRSGVRMTKKRMAALSVAPVMAQKASRFSINERFGFVGDMVTMLAQGDQASVVITGPGGLGKTFNVLSSLQKNGMQDLTSLEEFMEGTVVSTKKSFVVIKGYSTPKGLYRALYENRNGVIVFDDCDSILRDPVSLNLLKAALDSYERRVISWRADIRDDDLPTSFEFKGRVVFISNLSSVQLDQAILTRSLVVDLTMTNTQKVERMRFLLSQADFMPEYEREFKQDAMDLISKLQDDVKELSLRTLIQVTKIRKSSGKNWKNLAEYATCG
jgi:hypothetical protein